MQTPSRLILDGWLDCIKLYPKISKLRSSDIMLERVSVCLGYTNYTELINCNISFKMENVVKIMSRYAI